MEAGGSGFKRKLKASLADAIVAVFLFLFSLFRFRFFVFRWLSILFLRYLSFSFFINAYFFLCAAIYISLLDAVVRFVC